MKKIYQIPETEVVLMGKFCQDTIIEGPSEDNGEVFPLGNENKTFEEDVTDISTRSSLWDE